VHSLYAILCITYWILWLGISTYIEIKISCIHDVRAQYALSRWRTAIKLCTHVCMIIIIIMIYLFVSRSFVFSRVTLLHHLQSRWPRLARSPSCYTGRADDCSAAAVYYYNTALKYNCSYVLLSYWYKVWLLCLRAHSRTYRTCVRCTHTLTHTHTHTRDRYYTTSQQQQRCRRLLYTRISYLYLCI
jgi:hypothetical protein